jgi:hypothetical protein
MQGAHTIHPGSVTPVVDTTYAIDPDAHELARATSLLRHRQTFAGVCECWLVASLIIHSQLVTERSRDSRLEAMPERAVE